MSDSRKSHSLVVGARGSIGSAVSITLTARGDEVIGTTHVEGAEGLVHLPLDPESIRTSVRTLPEFSCVVFCQGVNRNDKIGCLQSSSLTEVLSANVVYCANVLDALVATSRIEHGARIVVVSSIWQEIARNNKFSYSVSKAALGGFTRGAAADLAERKILVNAVLPGPIDNEMTRQALNDGQIAALKNATPLQQLVEPQDVASLVEFLTSSRNRSITGQSIVIDCGLSNLRNLE